MVRGYAKDNKKIFDVEDFLAGLSGDEPFEHLQKFVELAVDSNSVDVVKEFVEYSFQGMHSTDIVRLISREITVSQLTTIFKALQEIFIRIASDLSDYSNWALTLIRRITEPDKIVNIHRGLSLGNTSTEIITTLRFLISIVMTGYDAAKEIHSKIMWKKGLVELLSRTDSHAEKDVRYCLIEFLLSFFVVGNSIFKQIMLDSNDLLVAVFEKLPVDKCSTIKMFLNGITSYDTSISKTNKIRLLNSSTLQHIVNLFNWKGVKKFQKRRQKLTQAEREAGGEVVGESSEEEIDMVHRLAQEFLIAVCCSTKKGIAFVDPLMGTGSDMNFHIRHVLTTAKPFTNQRMEVAYLEIFKSCPGEIGLYFENLHHFLAPRVSDMWFSAMSFIIKVFEEVDLMNVISTVNFNVSMDTLVDMFINVCCTKSLFSSLLIQILQHNNSSVRHQAIKYIQTVLKKTSKLIDEANPEAQCLKSKISAFDQFKDTLTQRIFNLLPSMEGFLRFWEVTVRETPEKSVGIDDREISLYDQLCNLLNIFSMYTNKKLSDADVQSRSMVNLLNSAFTLTDKLEPEEQIDIQVKILRCLADNVKDGSILLDEIQGKTVVSILLSTLRSTTEVNYHRLCTDILKDLLTCTPAFVSYGDELDIWLQNLLLVDKKALHVDEFFNDVCKAIATEPQPYIDEVKSFMLSEGQTSNETDEAFNDIFDAIMNGDNYNELEHESILTPSYHSFSPFVAAAFKLLSTKPYSPVCQKYFSSVVEELMVSRADIYPLFNYVKDRADCLSTSFQNYLKIWIQRLSNGKVDEVQIDVGNDLRSLIRSGFRLGKLPLKCTKNLPEMLKNCSKVELLVCSYEILTFIYILLQQKKSNKIIDVYCEILEAIINHKKEVEASFIDPFQVELGWSTVSQLLTHLSKLTHSYWISKDKLNEVGHFIIKVIDRASYLHSKAEERVRNTIVTAEVLQKFFQHYIELNGTRAATDFGNSLYKLVSSNSLYVFAINQEIINKLLQQVDNPVSRKISGLLSLRHLEGFEDYFMDLENFDGYDDLLAPYFDSSNYSLCRTGKSNFIFKKMTDYFWPRILSSLDDNCNVLNADLINNFFKWASINQYADFETLHQFAGQYSSALFKSILNPVLLMNTKWIYEQLFEDGQLINNYNPLSLWAYNWLQYILPRLSEKYEKSEVEQVCAVIEAFDKLPEFGKVLHQEKIWHRLIKTTLKLGFMNENGIVVLKLLSAVLKKLKLNGELWSIHCTSIYSMVVSHSNFVPGILDRSSSKYEWKNNVVDLLVFLTETEKTCCDKAHIPVLLSVYGATLSQLDQKILYLIFLYEKSGIDIQNFRPFVWGPSAIGHYTLDKSLTHSLWKKPSMTEIMDLLDDQIVLKTAYEFPLNLKLQPDVTSVEDNLKNLYDSRFLQLLFNNLLSPEFLVDCRKFVNSNGLLFLVASLSSEDADMRAMSYHNLAFFYNHLEGSNFRQKEFWLCILSLLKNSVVEENMQLPSLITTFIIKCCLIFDNPRDLMYKPLIDFIFLKPRLDLIYVPEFITFFHSGDVHHHEVYRNWMSQYLAVGFRSKLDYVLCHNRHVFKFIMIYFDSPIASNPGRLNILAFFKKVTKISMVASKLVIRYAFMPFIGSALKQGNDEIIALCVDIISNLWEHVSRKEYFLSETLSLLLAAMPKFRTYQSALTTHKYFKVLASCLIACSQIANIVQKLLTAAHTSLLFELTKSIKERVTDSYTDDGLQRSCADSVCDVIINWLCEVDEPTFIYLSDFLFLNIKPISNSTKIEPLYRWLESTLRHLHLSSVTRNLLEHLFLCYEHVLFENKETVSQKLSQLQVLNLTFISIIDKLTEIEDDYQPHPLLSHLSSKDVQQLLQSSTLKKIMRKSGNALEIYTLSVGACELWTFSSKLEICENYTKLKAEKKINKRKAKDNNKKLSKKLKNIVQIKELQDN
ncbi:nucleolar pre-ribosomal-associated protein 1 [Chamberlinius hualienensis]